MSRLLLLGLTLLTSQVAPPAHPFEPDIAKFEAADAQTPPPRNAVVFVGSSSVVRWSTLATDFPSVTSINRGFGGSQIDDSVYFAKRIVTPYKPKIVVLFAGTNDIAAGKSADTVFGDYKRFVDVVHAELPKTQIIYISMSPAPSRWAKVGEMKKANGLIAGYAKHHPNLYFVNTFPHMIDAKGGPRPELFVEDQLHLNPSGYKIVSDALRPVLMKLWTK